MIKWSEWQKWQDVPDGAVPLSCHICGGVMRYEYGTIYRCEGCGVTADYIPYQELYGDGGMDNGAKIDKQEEAARAGTTIDPTRSTATPARDHAWGGGETAPRSIFGF